MAAGNGHAEKLKAWRTARGLSQAALAKQAGLSLRTVTNYEYGKVRDPRLSTLQAIAKALEISIDELVGPPPAKRPRPRRSTLVR